MPRNWNDRELLIAMNVYCKLPFGKLSSRNPLIVQVAKKMNRTPSSVSMKLCNLASFDPALQARGIKGLRGASQADRNVWDAFSNDWDDMADKSEAAFEALMKGDSFETPEATPQPPAGPSEVYRTVKTRRLQTFFHNTVFSSYEYRCAISGMTIESMLVASHIVPWSVDESLRANPTNGLCLNALYDRAFDRGLITFDEDFRMVLSNFLKKGKPPEFQNINFLKMEGTKLQLPHRYCPNPLSMERHRNEIFLP